ncbi:collagen alpha-2(I) chain-like [Candoia aspera]|uniref:collagen alpha-2(I) chain-like n=1 Tax=Candoia aspera TaxID=51853 RepID=UPI002FD878DB
MTFEGKIGYVVMFHRSLCSSAGDEQLWAFVTVGLRLGAICWKTATEHLHSPTSVTADAEDHSRGAFRCPGSGLRLHRPALSPPRGSVVSTRQEDGRKAVWPPDLPGWPCAGVRHRQAPPSPPAVRLPVGPRRPFAAHFQGRRQSSSRGGQSQEEGSGGACAPFLPSLRAGVLTGPGRLAAPPECRGAERSGALRPGGKARGERPRGKRRTFPLQAPGERVKQARGLWGPAAFDPRPDALRLGVSSLTPLPERGNSGLPGNFGRANSRSCSSEAGKEGGRRLPGEKLVPASSRTTRNAAAAAGTTAALRLFLCPSGRTSPSPRPERCLSRLSLTLERELTASKNISG